MRSGGHKIARPGPWLLGFHRPLGQPATWTNNQQKLGTLPHFLSPTQFFSLLFPFFFLIQIFVGIYVPCLLSWCFHVSLLPLTSEAFSGFPLLHTQTSELTPLLCAIHNCTTLSCFCPLGFSVQTCTEVWKRFPNKQLETKFQKRN